MPDFKIYQEDERVKWDDFIAHAPHADIMQSWEWGNVKEGFSVWQVKRLGWEENGKLVAAAQVLKRDLPLGYKLCYVPRGPVLNWQNIELVREILSSLVSWARQNEWLSSALFLRLEPPTEPSSELAAFFLSSGFRPYFKTVQPPRTLLIDLDKSHDEVFTNFRRTARNLTRRCEKEGIRVEVFSGPEIKTHLEDFYRIYSETAERFSFPTRPMKQFDLITSEFGSRSMLRLYKTIAPDGKILTAGLVTIIGAKAFYIWGGSIREHPLAKFASYGYIWSMLSDLQRQGVKTFDFWGFAPGAEIGDQGFEISKEHPWYGFSLFKAAFGGTAFDYASAFDLPLSILYPVFKIIDRVTTPKYRATSS